MITPFLQIGGVGQSSKKMMEADPDFLMGRVFCLVSEIYGGTYSNPDQRKKVFELKKSSEKRKISNWERSHIEALCHTSNDNQVYVQWTGHCIPSPLSKVCNGTSRLSFFCCFSVRWRSK